MHAPRDRFEGESACMGSAGVSEGVGDVDTVGHVLERDEGVMLTGVVVP